MNFMNPEKNILENEEIEREEQAIGEPTVTKEEEEQLDLEKRMEEADQANEVEFNDNWGE
jgi:hypothetical protein